MPRRYSLALAALVCAATPAMARETASDISVAATTAGEAVRALARQTGVSVGFSDSVLAQSRVRAVDGHLTIEQALARLLAGSGLHARSLGPGVWQIEPAARRPVAKAVGPAPRIATMPSPEIIGDEIVVIATKRHVPLRSYPGDVEILSGDSLSLARGKNGTDQIEAQVASVTSTQLGPGRNKLFIRGIADSSIVGPTQATVGQYWDNSRITYNAPDPSLRLYDIDRIEVLQGPQGTLYGAGSLGGVVRVVPNAPNLNTPSLREWGGVTAIQNAQAGADGGVIVNLPLVNDQLGLRMVGFGGLDGGYIDDTLRKLNNINSVRSWGARSGLRFAPTDNWTVDLTLLTQRIAGADGQYADANGNGLTRQSSIAQPYSNAILFGDLAVKRQWNDIELTTSLAYADQHVFEQYEGAAQSNPEQPGNPSPPPDALATAYTQDNRISMIGGEVRLARERRNGAGWLIAMSVLHSFDRIHRQEGGTDTSALMLPNGQFGGPVPVSPLIGENSRVDEFTLYGEYSLELARRLTLTVGGRATRSRLAGTYNNATRAQALSQDPSATAVRDETRAMPSAALAYRPTDDLTLFSRFEESFRPGGITIQQNYIERFNSDQVLTGEVGARLGNRALDLSVTVSWTDWKNIQADLIDGFGFPATANIGDGHVLSSGWSARWRPMNGLQLEGAVFLNDSHITQTNSATQAVIGASLDSSRLPNIADCTARAALAYGTLIGAEDRLDLSGSARYTGKSLLGVGSILGREQGNYVDTGLDLRLGNARRSLTLTLANLLNARGNRFSFGSPFLLRTENQITPMQPRSLRLGFEFSF